MDTAIQAAITETMRPWSALPDGEYAIVELFGHTTLIGRVEEVERFGAKMLCIQPLFSRVLLDPVYHGGAAIYRFTPCTKKIAWDRQPMHDYQLPPTIKAVVPQHLLTSSENNPWVGETDHDDAN